MKRSLAHLLAIIMIAVTLSRVVFLERTSTNTEKISNSSPNLRKEGIENNNIDIALNAIPLQYTTSIPVNPESFLLTDVTQP